MTPLRTRPEPAARSPKKVVLVSLGCAKNLVDSEVMLGELRRSGYAPVARPAEADVLIVNTCGFIGPAREEAEKAIASALRHKRRDPRKRVIVAGCYVERDEPGLRERFPEVDAWTGVRSFDRIAEIVRGGTPQPGDRTFLYSDRSPRLVSTPGTWAYVKVSEGCSHRCGFCSIPLIKGPYRSRSMASVEREVRALAGLGVKEVNLISHDTTYYGRDRGLRDGLVRLLERLLPVRGLEWIRVLYGYPEEVTDRLLEVMTEPKVCRYLDIPFQHADAGLIKAMKRGLDGRRALDLLSRIRDKVAGVAVRTSLIVGFPGEGRAEFAALLRFVERARFDHLGVFTYSPERGTASFGRPETVAPAEKARRRAEVMALQAEISRAKNRAYLGRTVEVLVERAAGPRRLVGRTRFQAPEVDGRITLTRSGMKSVPPPPIVTAVVTGAGPYDLTGKAAA